ncbi:MAG: GGDEF domain-containing protein [Terracidiphilus sp.]|jgi:diguanylate cyclase (GGDEF)-like protein
MKRPILEVAIILGWASTAWAGAPAPLTTLRAIHALGNAEAAQHLPVAFEATVSFIRASEQLLFVQDDNVAVFVFIPTNTRLALGDRILVRGTMRPSFRPIVLSDNILLLHHGVRPAPVTATYGEMIHNQRDCMTVNVRVTVHTADPMRSRNSHGALLKLFTDTGEFDAEIESADPGALDDLLDAEVEITGVTSGLFDSKMEQVGVLLHASTMADVKILKRAKSSPWTLPLQPMDEIISGYQVRNLSARVRVHGTITYYQPATAVVLQDGKRSLWVQTATTKPLRIGDQADATGFPDVHDGMLNLAGGEVQDSEVYSPITPHQATWRDLSYRSNIDFGHSYDLVSIEGQVVTEAREATQDVYVLSTDGHMFSAIFRHSDLEPPPLREIPVGSGVRVTGICVAEVSNRSRDNPPFNILLRSYDDIMVVAKPSLLNVRNLMILVGLLLAVIVAVAARGWAIERKVRRQVAALALIEQRRGRILEDINGSRPLTEIIDEITELVSFKLSGAPCWCKIADGALLGNCPPKLTGLRVVQNEIPSRSGPTLGTMFVALDPLAKPAANESEAMSMASALSALAIETRRLYTELHHRSEFDLLTDTHNRFSLDKHLDRQIAETSQNADIFGLIYIDLDKFKQINDAYGHQFGDLYLQAVALRMKRQLRSVDLLARIGGDEFAVMLPLVHNRAKVEEIAERLERSFEEPFMIKGQALYSAASFGIAIYPEDGDARDDLLTSADAAMYVAKNAKHAVR